MSSNDHNEEQLELEVEGDFANKIIDFINQKNRKEDQLIEISDDFIEDSGLEEEKAGEEEEEHKYLQVVEDYVGPEDLEDQDEEQQEQEGEGEESEKSISEQYIPPNLKNTGKKTSKKPEPPSSSQSNTMPKKRGRKRKVQFQDDTSSYSNQLRQKKKYSQSQKDQIDMRKEYIFLKQFFRQFLNHGMCKIQQQTNQVLKNIVRRIDRLQRQFSQQSSMQVSRNRKNIEPEYIPQKPQGKKPNRPNTYIKSWKKLQCIQKIQNGERTIKQIANQLNVSEDRVQKWIADRYNIEEQVGKKYNKRPQSQEEDDMNLDDYLIE